MLPADVCMRDSRVAALRTKGSSSSREGAHGPPRAGHGAGCGDQKLDRHAAPVVRGGLESSPACVKYQPSHFVLIRSQPLPRASLCSVRPDAKDRQRCWPSTAVQRRPGCAGQAGTEDPEGGPREVSPR